MAAVGTAAVVAAFMVGVEEASTAAVVANPAVEAEPVGDLTRLRPPVMEALAVPRLTLRGTGVVTPRGLATIIPDLAAILLAVINGMEIPLLRPLQVPAGNGILLAAHREHEDLQEHNPQQGLLRIREASTSLAGIAGQELPAGCEAFRGRAVRSMRIHPGREMLSRGLNRCPCCTIRSKDLSPQIPGFTQTQRSQPRALQADQGSWERKDFRVARILATPITKRAA
jgi:hypothetical protein